MFAIVQSIQVRKKFLVIKEFYSEKLISLSNCIKFFYYYEVLLILF